MNSFENFFSEVKKEQQVGPVMIKLPNHDGVTVSEFSANIGDVYANKQVLFYKPDLRTVVEIRNVKIKGGEEFSGLAEIDPKRFVTLSEKYVVFYITNYTKNNSTIELVKSMSITHASLALVAPQFQDQLKNIKRIYTFPAPIIYEGELTLPRKGYDERFQSWLLQDAPEIDRNYPVEKAKELILDLFSEFCFKDEQSKTHAIAALLTPFLRGLYQPAKNNTTQKFNARTPLYMFLANRERCGKDYCAGIMGIVYEGKSEEQSPISTGEKGVSINEELRKKILTFLIYGKKRLHFSNNKGHIDSAVLEAVLTSKTFEDRLLGKNETVSVDNECDFSISGNMGLSYTPDLANRSRIIMLELDLEDPNERQFQRADLHQYVLEKRSEILSAMFALVREWVKAGCPKGETPFASFPEWASVCGGIMKQADLGNPCLKSEGLAVGGDEATEDMKVFFGVLAEKIGIKKSFTKTEVMNIIVSDAEEYEIFKWLDTTKQGWRSRFGKQWERYVGRIFSGIKLIRISLSGVRAARVEYMLTKPLVGLVGLVVPQAQLKFENTNIYQGSPLTNPTNPTINNTQSSLNNNSLTESSFNVVGADFDLLGFLREADKGQGVTFDQLWEAYPEPKERLGIDLSQAKFKGEVFEPKPGFYKVLQ